MLRLLSKRFLLVVIYAAAGHGFEVRAESESYYGHRIVYDGDSAVVTDFPVPLASIKPNRVYRRQIIDAEGREQSQFLLSLVTGTFKNINIDEIVSRYFDENWRPSMDLGEITLHSFPIDPFTVLSADFFDHDSDRPAEMLFSLRVIDQAQEDVTASYFLKVIEGSEEDTLKFKNKLLEKPENQSVKHVLDFRWLHLPEMSGRKSVIHIAYMSSLRAGIISIEKEPASGWRIVRRDQSRIQIDNAGQSIKGNYPEKYGALKSRAPQPSASNSPSMRSPPPLLPPFADGGRNELGMPKFGSSRPMRPGDLLPPF